MGWGRNGTERKNGTERNGTERKNSGSERNGTERKRNGTENGTEGFEKARNGTERNGWNGGTPGTFCEKGHPPPYNVYPTSTPLGSVTLGRGPLDRCVAVFYQITFYYILLYFPTFYCIL